MMDSSLRTLLAFPQHPLPASITLKQYDDAALKHIDQIKRIPEKNLMYPAPNGELPLNIINPATHTISYCRILQVNIEAAKGAKDDVDFALLWEKILEFLRTFDQRQIRYVGSGLVGILKHVAVVAENQQDPALAVGPIRDALHRLDETGSVITFYHLMMARLVSTAKNFEEIDTPNLQQPAYYFLASSNTKGKYPCDMTLPPMVHLNLTLGPSAAMSPYQMCLEYFYLMGTAFLGLRNWDVAIDYLECGIRYPCKDSPSKFMVECYKKWILACLIRNGKLPSLPKATSSTASKSYHICAKPYETLAQIFESGTASRLKAEADAGFQEWWQKDANHGLVLNVLAAYQKHQIRNLANIHTKMTINEIHNQTSSAGTGSKKPSVQSTEDLVEEMITSGELQATLTPSPNGPSVLKFSLSSNAKTEAQVAAELLATTQRILALSQEVRQTDHTFTQDKEYLKHVQKQRKAAKNGTPVEQTIETSWNDMVEDEDIMGGY